MSLLKAQRVSLTLMDPNLGIHKLADTFKCWKTQMTSTLKDKVAILQTHKKNNQEKGAIIQARKRYRISGFADVNKALYEWYLIAVSKGIHPNGIQISEKGEMIAERLEHPILLPPMEGSINGRKGTVLRQRLSRVNLVQ